MAEDTLIEYPTAGGETDDSDEGDGSELLELDGPRLLPEEQEAADKKDQAS